MMSPLFEFVLRLLCVDMLLLLAHTFYSRVLVDDVVATCDYGMRTLSLAWLIHKYVQARIKAHETEMRRTVLSQFHSLAKQVQALHALVAE